MLYFFTIVLGLLIVLLMFFQLINEKRIQKKQIELMFGNLAIAVYCSDKLAPNPNLAPDIEYNIISTSITCGRKSEVQKHQIDLAIDTNDETLKTTSAVITTVANKSGLEISVSCVEQPFIVVQHVYHDEDHPEFEFNLSKEEKKKQVKRIRRQRQDPRDPGNYNCDHIETFLGRSLKKVPLGFNPNSFEIPVKIGDKILLGNTLLVIDKIQIN